MKQTNAEFAKENKLFIASCELAGVEPSKRQAGRFRRGTGAAFEAQVNASLAFASIKRFASRLGVRGVSKKRAADRREVIIACKQQVTLL